MSKTVRVNKPACITPGLPRASLIEASAGTGKTYAITRLVAEWVLEAKIPIERILVVTFTRKAAADMTNRIHAALRELLEKETSDSGKGPAWIIDDDARARIASAIANFDQAAISTIHSFCQRVLDEQVILSGLVRDVSPGDVGELFHDAFTSHLRTVPHAGGEPLEVLAAWLRVAGTVESLEEVLEKACGEVREPADPLSRLRPRVDHAALVKRSAGLRRAFRDAGWPDLTSLRTDGVPEKELPAVLDALAELRRHCVSEQTERLPALAFQLHFLETAGRLRRSCVFISSEVLAGKTAKLAGHVRELYEAAKTKEGVALDVFFPPVYRAFDEACRRGGAPSMSRLIQDTQEAIRRDDSGALLRRLRERFQGVLVDEFQDTDEVQWDILRALFVDGEAGTRFVAVGDPKQAIYRFRGGDFETYRAARATLSASGGGKVRLVENRRSTPALVESYNRILAEVVNDDPFFGDPIHGLTYSGMDVVSAAGQVGELRDEARGEASRPLGIFRLHPIAKQSSAVRLRQEVVREAQRLVGGGFTLPAGKDGKRRSLVPSDLMVLVASNREAGEYVQALNAAGVRAEQYRADGLLNGNEAKEVLEVLEALANPEARASLVKVMRTLFFEVPFEQLEQVQALGSEDVRLRTWRAWVKAARDRNWVALFGGMRDAAHLRRRAARSADGERRLLTVHAVLDRVHAIARDRCPDVAALVRRLEAIQDGDADAEMPDSDANTYPVAEVDAVRVLTVFKAKGLEAPVVFLALAPKSKFTPDDFYLEAFHGPGPGGKSIRLSWAGELDDPTGRQIVLEEELEARRVQYVALTRAQYRTWLPLVTREPSSKKPGSGDGAPLAAGPENTVRYHAINTRLFQLMRDPSFAALCEERVVGELADETEGPTAIPTGSPPNARVQPGEVKQARHAARGLRKGSFSSLGLSFGTGKSAQEKPAAAEVGEAEMPRGADAGTVMHAFLEHAPLDTVVPGQSFEQWMALEKVKEFTAEQFVPRQWTAPQREDLLRLVHAGLHLPVALPRAEPVASLGALGDRLYREVDFHLPWSSSPFLAEVKGRWKVDHGFLTGSLDLVFEHQDRVYFGDWKSNALKDYGKSLVDEVVRSTYEAQVRIYTLALCRVFGIFDESSYEKRFGGAVYLFLRGFKQGGGAGLGFYRPSWMQLGELEEQLAAKVKEPPQVSEERADDEHVEGAPHLKDDDEPGLAAEVTA